jgi:hypothetical protein
VFLRRNSENSATNANIAAVDSSFGPNQELGVFSFLINGVTEGTSDRLA